MPLPCRAKALLVLALHISFPPRGEVHAITLPTAADGQSLVCGDTTCQVRPIATASKYDSSTMCGRQSAANCHWCRPLRARDDD